MSPCSAAVRYNGASNKLTPISPGALHSGVEYPEVLVNATSEGGSAYVQWVYNSTAEVVVGDVSMSNYQAVYKSYDPTFPSECTLFGNHVNDC